MTEQQIEAAPAMPLTSGYRLARKPDGTLVLQRQWVQTARVNGALMIQGEGEWRDEPTIELPE